MIIRPFLSVGFKTDQLESHEKGMLPMLAKDCGTGFAFFNWTYTPDYDVDEPMHDMAQAKYLALQAVSTPTTLPRVLCHHIKANSARSVAEELEVLIDMLDDGIKILFCLDTPTKAEAEASFTQAVMPGMLEAHLDDRQPLFSKEAQVTIAAPFIDLEDAFLHSDLQTRVTD